MSSRTRSGRSPGPGSRLFRSIYRTYRTVFPTVLVHPGDPRRRPGRRDVPEPDPRGDRAGGPQRVFLAQRWEEIRREAPTAPDLRQAILDRHDALIPTDDVPVLTDDYAPTDALLLSSSSNGKAYAWAASSAEERPSPRRRGCPARRSSPPRRTRAARSSARQRRRGAAPRRCRRPERGHRAPAPSWTRSAALRP